MAKKKQVAPVKSTIARKVTKKVAPKQKKTSTLKVRVSESKIDKRDKPNKSLAKKSITKNIKGLLKDSAKREKEIKKDIAKRTAAKKVRAKQRAVAGKVFGKTLKITNKKVNKKVTKSAKTTTTRYKKPTAKKKYKYKNPYLDELTVYKKKVLRKPDKEELKRIKKNLINARYRTVSILKKDITKKKRGRKNTLTKKDTNKFYRKEIDLSVAIKKINIKLGIAEKPNKVTNKKVTVKKQKVTVKVKKKGKKTVEKEVEKIIKKEVLPIWEGRDKLSDLLKTKLFTTYVINGGSYTRQQQPELFLEFSKMEIRVRSIGVSTPHVIFYQRITDKICEISEYAY